MRLNDFVVWRHIAAAVLLGLAGTVHAQSLDAPAGAPATAASAGVSADVTPATLDTSARPTGGAASGPLAADPVPPSDDSLMAGTRPLDDQTLSNQRGGAVGMLMVAATPQLMRGGNSVTLWDEIAPPAPLPVPIDSSQTAQGNIASYTRK